MLISQSIFYFFLYTILLEANFPPTKEKESRIGKQVLRWLFSFVISFLAIAFITPEDLVGVLTTYSALGLTLTIFIPFTPVIMYTVNAVTKKDISILNLLLANFMWILFSLFLLYRTVMLFLSHQVPGALVVVISILALGIALFISFRFKSFIRKIIEFLGHKEELIAERKMLERDIKTMEDQQRQFLEEIENDALMKEWHKKRIKKRHERIFGK